MLVFPSSSPFYRCLSSLLPSCCSVVWADVCPGCWMKTSTSSPSLSSLVMCMLLQLTSSLCYDFYKKNLLCFTSIVINSQHPTIYLILISLVRALVYLALCSHVFSSSFWTTLISNCYAHHVAWSFSNRNCSNNTHVPSHISACHLWVDTCQDISVKRLTACHYTHTPQSQPWRAN